MGLRRSFVLPDVLAPDLHVVFCGTAPGTRSARDGAYYAHPYAWDEIGFGGPAYPRGYFALNNGAPEPWEPRESGE